MILLGWVDRILWILFFVLSFVSQAEFCCQGLLCDSCHTSFARIPVMTSPTLLQLARQGNPGAIAQLVNHALNARGIQARTTVRENCLQIVLEAEVPPTPDKIVPYLHRGLLQLEAASIHTVKIYGRQNGQLVPSWGRVVHLLPAPVRLLEHQKLSTRQQLTGADQFSNHISESSQVHFIEKSSPSMAIISTLQEAEVMPYLKTFQNLTSILLICIGIQICFDLILVLYLFLKILLTYFYQNSSPYSVETSLISFQILSMTIHQGWRSLGLLPRFLSGLTLGLMLLWLYRLHVDLRQIFRGYPISPWGAIARYLIPLYNLVGIWQTFTVLSEHLKEPRSAAWDWSKALQRWLPWFYGGWLMSSSLELIYRFQFHQSNPNPSLWFLLGLNGAALFSRVGWLQLVRLPSQAIANQFKLQRDTQSILGEHRLGRNSGSSSCT